MDVVFVDFSKAFETLSCKVSLGNMEQMSEQQGGLRTGRLAELGELSLVAQSTVGGLQLAVFPGGIYWFLSCLMSLSMTWTKE